VVPQGRNQDHHTANDSQRFENFGHAEY
jgi:hypothetical protein